MASATSRSTCATPHRCAKPTTCRSTHPAASGVSGVAAWMVASATRRARHAGTWPAWTAAHSRGSRCRSSNACPTRCLAETLDIPSTAPSSGMQNSATSGHPGPAIGSTCSSRAREPGRVVDRLRRVQVGPVARDAPAAGLGPVRGGPGRSRGASTAAGLTPDAVSETDCCSIMCSILEESTDTDSRAEARPKRRTASNSAVHFALHVGSATCRRGGSDYVPVPWPTCD